MKAIIHTWVGHGVQGVLEQLPVVGHHVQRVRGLPGVAGVAAVDTCKQLVSCK